MSERVATLRIRAEKMPKFDYAYYRPIGVDVLVEGEVVATLHATDISWELRHDAVSVLRLGVLTAYVEVGAEREGVEPDKKEVGS